MCNVLWPENAYVLLFECKYWHLLTVSFSAFNFKLDYSSSHQNLKVEDMNVEWDGSGGKPQDIRKEKNRTNSPMHSPARFV